MGARKTPAAVAKILRLAAQGLSEREIVPMVGFSKGTVGAVIRDARARGRLGPVNAPTSAPAPEPAAVVTQEAAPVGPTEPAAPMDAAEFGAWLSGQLRAQQSEADRCRVAGDTVGAQRASRLAVSLAGLLSKHQTRTTDERDIVKVKVSEIDAAAEQTRERMHRTVEAILDEQSKWPRCPQCGRPVRPDGLEEMPQSPAGKWARSLVEASTNATRGPVQRKGVAR